MRRFAERGPEGTDEVRLGHVGEAGEVRDVDRMCERSVDRVPSPQHAAVAFLDGAAHKAMKARWPYRSTERRLNSQNTTGCLPELWHPSSVLGITDLPTYLAGLAVIIVMPGPNSLYVLSVAARMGVRPGYRAALGVFCGDTTLMVLSAAGVASLLRASPVAFSVVKILGAGYLTWLAIGMLRGAWRGWRRRAAIAAAPSRERTAGIGDTAGPTPRAERPYRRALVASLLNPKAILFFISFFVQFVDPAYPYPALSFLVLGFWVQLFSLTYLSLLIFSGARLAAAFRQRRALQVGGSAAASGAFLAFAVKLSLASAA